MVLSEKILLSFKSLKLAQNLHGNKTGFVRLGHIYMYIYVTGFGKTNQVVTFCISRNTVLKY